LLSRILANRLKRWLPAIMHPQQFCGTSDNNIYGALAAMRETIAHSEHTNAPACILSLDLQNAFDNIAHTYLFEILKAYGFSDIFRHRLRCLYTNATSLVRINNHLSSPIQFQSSIRQGCPLSMVLFAISINPLLRILDEKLLQLRGGKRTFGPALITYADDVTIVLRNPTEIQQVREVLQTYAATSSARLNIGKSRTLALGTWNASDDIMGDHTQN
jgi:hypothetical protein